MRHNISNTRNVFENFEFPGGRKISISLYWAINLRFPLPKGLQLFVHIDLSPFTQNQVTFIILIYVLNWKNVVINNLITLGEGFTV